MRLRQAGDNTKMRNLKLFQKGWNYSQDGPGNRLVYHLQGCNMRCPWCSNPEGFSKNGTFMVHEANLLDEVCPHGAIRHQKVNRLLCETCTGRECVTINKNQGIRFPCQSYPGADLLKEAVQSRPLFYDGGGVTLTGGEATLQFAAVKEFYTALQREGIHTALETNGTHPRLCELFPLLDTLIMDLKHYNHRIHHQTTGLDNKAILGNIQKAAREHPQVWLRIPLIPGFNDSAGDAEQFAAFLKQPHLERLPVELLPYHEFGRVKWAQCGLQYPFKTAAPPEGNVPAFMAVLQKNGLNLVRT